MNQILQNEVKCLKCNDIIFSGGRHQFVTCSCGNVSVDGGLSYLRRSWKTQEFEERSLSTDREQLEECVKSLQLFRRIEDVSGMANYVFAKYGCGEPMEEQLKELDMAAKWAIKNNRNSFGIVLAIIRAMRDNGILDMEKFNK
jgi:hypothetical protein